MAPKAKKDRRKGAIFTFIWAIENANTLSLSNKILSQTFVVQTLETTKWHLEAEYDDEEDSFILFICRERDDCCETFEIDYEFSLIGPEEFPYAELKGTGLFRKFGRQKCHVVFDSEVLCESLPNETLTVRYRMWRKGRDESLQPSDLCFARTRLAVEKHSFVGAIKRFSTLRPGQNRTIFLYPTFEGLPILILNFCLREKEGKEYGCITIHRSPSVVGSHLIYGDVWLLDVDGWSVTSTNNRIKGWITPEDEEVSEFCELCEKAEIMSNDANFLLNDVLFLRCELEVNAGALWSRIENVLQSSDEDTNASELCEAHLRGFAINCCPYKGILRNLYEDGTLSDVSLRAGYQSFSVHKNVLSARSPVFKAMFTKDMQEKMAACVTIPDLNSDTLGRLLLYIYTNRVEELDFDDAQDLYRAADKYELLKLREKCSDVLKANLCSANACGILVLADMYHDEVLRKAVQNLMSHDSDIFYSDEWKYLKEFHTKLAFETVEQIICDKKDSRG